MGAILPFVARDASRKSTKSPAGGEGAIIIFLGVRYERPWKADDAACRPRRRPSGTWDRRSR